MRLRGESGGRREEPRLPLIQHLGEILEDPAIIFFSRLSLSGRGLVIIICQIRDLGSVKARHPTDEAAIAVKAMEMSD